MAEFDAFQAALEANTTARVVIVDTSNANVDYANAQVASATGAEDHGRSRGRRQLRVRSSPAHRHAHGCPGR